jgi:hypothetical protein
VHYPKSLFFPFAFSLVGGVRTERLKTSGSFSSDHAEYRIMPTSGGQAIAFSNVDSLFSKVLLGMIGIEIFGLLRRQTACHLWLSLKPPINLQG